MVTSDVELHFITYFMGNWCIWTGDIEFFSILYRTIFHKHGWRDKSFPAD